MDREHLRRRLLKRIDAMFAGGLEQEVARLKAAYPVWSRTAAGAIGYKEFFLPPKVPGRTVREEIYFRTSKFAKRQDTWFRHQAEPMWVDASDDVQETAARVRALWRAHGPWHVNEL
jgi:tRNA dimethylallyltransferase